MPVSPSAGTDSSTWILEYRFKAGRETLLSDKTEKNYPKHVRVDQVSCDCSDLLELGVGYTRYATGGMS